MMLSDEWGDWEMGDDFGFYEDLDDDNDGGVFGVSHASLPSSSHGGGSTCSSSSHRPIDDPRPETLKSSPPILSPVIIDQISENGLPWSMQDMKWTRIYNSTRDGTSFGQFMRSVRNVSQTIIVALTNDGRVVGGYTEDVWSGGKSSSSSRREVEMRNHHAFLFVVDHHPPASASTGATTTTTTTTVTNKAEQSSSRFGRFIPGLEDIASSPTGVLEFNFDSLSISSSNKNKKEQQQQQQQVILHIFKPSPRQASLKQVCQLGNRFISLGDEQHMTYLAIENSFSRGGVTMMTSSIDGGGDGGMITEEFDVVDFEVYCLSDD